MTQEEVRGRILQAAGDVFARRGYRAATVRQICQAAGVNLASVNYYFGDKQSLYLEAVREARRQRAAAVPHAEFPPETDAASRLRAFIVTLLGRMLRFDAADWQSQLMMREILQPSDACRELVRDHFRPEFERLTGLIRELLPVGTPAHRVRQMGFSVIGQCLFYRTAGEVASMLTPDEERKHFQIEGLADHITRVVLAATGRIDLPAAWTDRGPAVDERAPGQAEPVAGRTGS